MMKLPQKIQKAVKKWRNNNYPDVSKTTKRLLEYWFYEDHIFQDHPNFEDGTPFHFWACQREAIETIIYLYEVCGYESLFEIQRGFDVSIPNYDATEDIWPKYCFKMATGSGKTFVMAMVLVWQYFNHLKEGKDDSTNRFLLIAPNLIVLDRLMDGFDNGGVFEEFPFFIPDEWRADFDLQIIEQTSENPPHSQGVIHITNVQQLYERDQNEEENPVQELLGKKPAKGEEFLSRVNLKDIVKKYDKIIALNDEAHHAHVETNWNQALHEIHGEEERILLQLDFTATAWDIAREQEVPLPHIVYNYSLKRALEADPPIIKNPIIASIKGQQQLASDELIKHYQPQMHTAKEFLERRKDDLEDVNKKPVLFVVCQLTDEADKVAEYFRNDLSYGNRVLVIHTYLRGGKYGRKGDVKRDDLEIARQAAKNIDDNKYEVVISVGMLQEGWDVRNVSVILPMRAFESDILVEQSLGRGLRRMFPNDPDIDDNLYVIEHPRFRDLWEEKIKAEDLPIEVKSGREAYQESNKIHVLEDKEEYNFVIPVMKGGIVSTVPDLSQIDLEKFPNNIFSLEDIKVVTPRVIEEQLKDKKIVGEWELKFNFAPTKEEYLAYLAKGILKKGGSSSQFAQLVPILQKYLKYHFFSENISKIDEEILKKMNSFKVRNKVADIFVRKLNELSQSKKEYTPVREYNLMDTKPIHTSKPIYKANKTVFNALPYPKSSSFEKKFMRYLDSQREVLAFTKILNKFPLRISYYDEEKGVRYYIPDFIAKTKESFYLIETKGEMFDKLPSVKQKAEAAKSWCRNATELSNTEWKYVKTRQNIFEQNRGSDFQTLIDLSG